jgi:hypothetical protein
MPPSRNARPLVDAHQAAPHQRLQRRRRQVARPQLSQRQARRRMPPTPPESPAACGQRGQARFGNQHGKALGPPRIALRRSVSRAIHFLRTRPPSTGSVAAVAVRSVETFTGSPEASRVSTRCSRSCSSGESAAALKELRRTGLQRPEDALHPPGSPVCLRPGNPRSASTSRPRSVMR